MYNKVVIVNSEGLGQGDQGVGYTLLGTFFRKVLASINKPDVIIFYNSGVKLLTNGSYYIDILEALEKSGVELLACGTCVYKACGQQSLLAGRISGMDEIAEIILKSQNTITL